MSGTGLTGPTPAEAHLGDRLAALVDGELNHDARERVLAHLATCARCKVEADAQRRLKSAFAMSAAPSPSEGFLARLQGLPGGPGGDDTGSGRPFGSGGPFADEFFPPLRSSGSTRRDPAAPSSPLDDFGYLPAAHGSTAVLPGGSGSAFRFHEVARDAERSPWRGRRFAFAAAGAVSLAAIALGGTLPLDSGPDPLLRAEGSGNSVTPLDAETRAGGSTETVSRRGGAQSVGGDRLAVNRSAADVSSTGGHQPSPLLPAPPAAVAPGVKPPLSPRAQTTTPPIFSSSPLGGHPFTFPVLNVSVPPLIRPTGGSTPLLATVLGGGSTAKALTPPVSSDPVRPTPTNDLASPLLPRR
ncbi:anti-sigma factor family protein [Streptomyces microflavus]|uniref:anti-sigma factor family protein n=1 Tax=Streptomyces TaxID=1883 RepID=UPI001A992EEC|nr:MULTISPECIES: zf-HC2 domain-containing protein [unclassified Streptomyces]MBW3360974.1 zf-HC2 domain-containing protein [Streptomyces sp. 09ZI22]MEE1732209.1 zf-HC2 domain-containing protein [Streptomyces sp. BE282]QTA34577.1 zf-HC2 domain-containing protein [Streptomyces sp. CA-256286]